MVRVFPSRRGAGECHAGLVSSDIGVLAPSLFLCPDKTPNSSSSHFWFLIIFYLSVLPFPSFFLLLIRASLSFSNQASFFEVIIYSLLLSFLALHMTAPWVKKKAQKKSQIKGETCKLVIRLFLRQLPLATEEQPFPISINYQSLFPGIFMSQCWKFPYTFYFKQRKRENAFLSCHAWKQLNSFN